MLRNSTKNTEKDYSNYSLKHLIKLTRTKFISPLKLGLLEFYYTNDTGGGNYMIYLSLIFTNEEKSENQRSRESQRHWNQPCLPRAEK